MYNLDMPSKSSSFLVSFSLNGISNLGVIRRDMKSCEVSFVR